MKIPGLNIIAGLFAVLFLSIACKNSEKKDDGDMAKADEDQLRAPVYQLITHNTYFSLWSMRDELNGQPIQHWTGADQSLFGILKVEGSYYRFLGAQSKSDETLVPTTDEKHYEVAYAETKPDAVWNTIGFDNKLWKKDGAPFSDDRPHAKTRWTIDFEKYGFDEHIDTSHQAGKTEIIQLGFG